MQLRQVRCHYRVGADLPEPRRVQAGLDSLLRTRVAERCGPLLAAGVGAAVGAGPGLVVVDRLDLHLALRADPAREPDQVARLLAHAVSRAVLGGIARVDDARVARYADWVDLVACFAAWVLRGSTVGRWRFTPLAAAAAGDRWPAVARALIERPDTTEAALVRLHREGLLPIVAAHLRESDAELVLAALVATLPPVTGGTADTDLAELARTHPPGASGPATTALALCGAAAARRPLTRETASTAVALVAGLELARASEASRRVRREDARPAEQDSMGSAPSPSPASSSREKPSPVAAPAQRPGAQAEVVTTPFGGLVLLVRPLAELALDDVTSAPETAAVLRRWVLLCALGPGRRSEGARDRGLALLAGSAGADGDADLAATQALATAEVAALLAPARQQRSPEDRVHLRGADLFAERVPGGPVGARVLEALTELSAQVVQRAAARVHGFAQSSAGYLATNVFTGWARMEVGPEALTCSLPQVPLRVVLQMTGTLTGDERVPWLPAGRLRHTGVP